MDIFSNQKGVAKYSGIRKAKQLNAGFKFKECY